MLGEIIQACRAGDIERVWELLFAGVPETLEHIESGRKTIEELMNDARVKHPDKFMDWWCTQKHAWLYSRSRGSEEGFGTDALEIGDEAENNGAA